MAAGVGDGGRSEGSGGRGDGDAVDTCDAADGTGEGDAEGRVEGEEEEAGDEAGAGEDGGGRTAATTVGSDCSRAPPMIAAAVTPPAQTSAVTASRTCRTGMGHIVAQSRPGVRPDFRRSPTAVDLILDEGERGRGR
jgi:hypothetical protein